jgi:hypothetical protein
MSKIHHEQWHRSMSINFRACINNRNNIISITEKHMQVHPKLKELLPASKMTCGYTDTSILMLQTEL